MNRRKVQCIVYAVKSGTPLFLLLKTTPARGAFWQAVTGTVEEGESYREAAGRELKEETGLSLEDAVKVVEEPYSFKFVDRRGDSVDEHAFGIEVDPESAVDMAHNVYEEHTEYAWLRSDEAVSKLRFEDEKKALLSVYWNI